MTTKVTIHNHGPEWIKLDIGNAKVGKVVYVEPGKECDEYVYGYDQEIRIYEIKQKPA